MTGLFEPNETIKLHYPATTHVGFSREVPHKPRLFKILRVRDLVRQPLTVEEFLRRPFVRRSRYLLLGDEGGNLRQFYVGNSKEFFSPSQLRLALYEPFSFRPHKLIARPFDDTLEERKQMLKILRSLPSLDFGDYELKVFADDLRLIA